MMSMTKMITFGNTFSMLSITSVKITYNVEFKMLFLYGGLQQYIDLVIHLIYQYVYNCDSCTILKHQLQCSYSQK